MFCIERITVEGLENNCITDRQPRIGFECSCDERDITLRRAKITIGDWERETVDQINNIYDGSLEPFTSYRVCVMAENNLGESAWGMTYFQTGRRGLPWQAHWITDASYCLKKNDSPIPMEFLHRFELKKQITDAWINATAMGIYNIYLNGQKVGEDYFAPGFTSYHNQLQYQTYPMKELLQEKNEIRVIVAGGWAVGPYCLKRTNRIYARRQALLCELHIRYSDGTEEVIGTNDTWRVSMDGCVRMAEWYNGETCDATIDQKKRCWKAADITKLSATPGITAQYGTPVRCQEILEPVASFLSESGEIIYDFGQNFAGVISAEIDGRKGQQIIFRHAEVIHNNELFVKSLRSAKAMVTYICTDGWQRYSPQYTYMGFRYVGVRGITEEKLHLKAYVLHSDFEKTGTFVCSNERLNQLQSNITWSGKSNFVDIPTDCPQRDERLGWTGDLAVFARTACYNFDLSRFLDKWLLDMKLEQGNGGGIPFVIPKAKDGWPTMASACWGDSCILVPWAEYLARGDIRLLKRQYPVMKKFMKACEGWAHAFSITKDGKRIWRLPFHWGDWCAPDASIIEWFLRTKWVATAYFANSSRILSKIAHELGEASDTLYYQQLYEDITRAYRNVFTDGKGNVKREFQSAYVLPLAFRMTEGNEAETMVENLHRLIQDNQGHLSTGFPGTPYILFALSDNGRADLAYELLLQETCPSWLYEVKAGATTIWERWDALKEDGSINTGDLVRRSQAKDDSGGGMVSFNHYANGAVGDWLYRRCLGLEAKEAGYKSFQMKPVTGGGITWAKGSVQSPYGWIHAEWHCQGDQILIQVDVPVNCRCTIVEPDGSRIVVGSGVTKVASKMIP